MVFVSETCENMCFLCFSLYEGLCPTIQLLVSITSFSLVQAKCQHLLFTAVCYVFPILTYLPNRRGNCSLPEGIYCVISSSVTTQETRALHLLSLSVLAITVTLGASISSPLKMPNSCSCTWITTYLFIPLNSFHQITVLLSKVSER